VTILLSICGLRVVHVGDEYEEVTKQSRHEKYRKTTIGLDIVAMPLAEDKEIFLCQCTTDWKSEKVADIQDISFELRQRIKSDEVKIYSVLITQVEVDQITRSKGSTEFEGVNAVIIDDVIMLLNEILNGNKPYELAKSILSGQFVTSIT